MVIRDKNETLQQPEGYALYSVQGEGAYLRLEYRLFEYNPARYAAIIVYLNDMGREVARCMVT